MIVLASSWLVTKHDAHWFTSTQIQTQEQTLFWSTCGSCVKIQARTQLDSCVVVGVQLLRNYNCTMLAKRNFLMHHACIINQIVGDWEHLVHGAC